MKLIATLAVLGLSGVGFGQSTAEEESAALNAHLTELENRLAAAEAKRNENWLTEQRSDEIRGLVEDVLADADTRSSMMAQGMSAGYEDGAYIQSSDGNWKIKANLLLQTRFVFNTQSNSPAIAGSDPTVWGFEVTRAVFNLTGNIVDPTWYYRVMINTSTNGSGVATPTFGGAPPVGSNGQIASLDARTGLLDAYVGKDFGNGWKVSAGQFRAPLLYSELVEEPYQQAVERSYLNYLFTGGYTQGILAEWSSDMIRVLASYNNGINDTLYSGGVVTSPGPGGTQAAALATDTEYAITARFEWLAQGAWEQFRDYTSPQGEEFGAMVGAAIHWQKSEGDIFVGAPPPVRNTLFVLTVDGSVELGGANVYAAFNYANADPNVGTNLSPWGFQVGGGWYWAETWELYGLYEYANMDNVLEPEDLSIITVGVNKYLSGHNAKWSTDFGWSLGSIPANVAATGYRADTQGAAVPDSKDQIVIRSQFQILF